MLGHLGQSAYDHLHHILILFVVMHFLRCTSSSDDIRRLQQIYQVYSQLFEKKLGTEGSTISTTDGEQRSEVCLCTLIQHITTIF